MAACLSVTVRVALLPGLINAVFLPAILKSCESLPLFVTTNDTEPAFAVLVDRTNLNSLAATFTEVACVCAPPAMTDEAPAPMRTAATVSAAERRRTDIKNPPKD